jgi:hypothetical protein
MSGEMSADIDVDAGESIYNLPLGPQGRLPEQEFTIYI